MPGSGRAASPNSATNCSPPCATSLGAMLNRNQADMDKVKQPGPCVLVIFGASGDLTKRLLVPALYHLKRANLLPEDFAILGVSRGSETNEQFRERLGT